MRYLRREAHDPRPGVRFRRKVRHASRTTARVLSESDKTRDDRQCERETFADLKFIPDFNAQRRHGSCDCYDHLPFTEVNLDRIPSVVRCVFEINA